MKAFICSNFGYKVFKASIIFGYIWRNLGYFVDFFSGILVFHYPPWPTLFNQHKVTFRHRKYTNSTELSKYIWQLKDNSVNFNIKWSIIARARPYNNTTKRCDLCLTEKLMIIKSNSNNLLNKRSKLISKCRHENKFYLKNI